jgi:hypothetical protein
VRVPITRRVQTTREAQPMKGITHLTLVPTKSKVMIGMKKQAKKTSGLRLVARDVRPDRRNRLALGKALKDFEDASFNVYQDERGRIVLDPQVSVPASEAWLYRNPKALASVRRGLADAAAGRTNSLGSFARYADEDDES